MATEPCVPEQLKIIITGQIRGGKNAIKTTRTGRRYPDKKWAQWRDQKVSEIRKQLPKGWEPIDFPVNCRLAYTAADKRRRDMPAICDSILHLMEKAGVVTDDTHIWFSEASRDWDQYSAGADVTIYL